MRIAVADQVARLETGRTPVDQFDFAFLRFRGGRYGLEALGRLRDRPGEPATEGARIAGWAITALSWAVPGDARRSANVATPASGVANIKVVFPDGQALPDSFLQQHWERTDNARYARCLGEVWKCEAVIADLDGDGTPEILLLDQTGASAYRKSDAAWEWLGYVMNVNCMDVRDSLRSGKFD